MRENQNERPIPGCRIMNKESFWRLIEEVKSICGQSRRKYLDMLRICSKTASKSREEVRDAIGMAHGDVVSFAVVSDDCAIVKREHICDKGCVSVWS